MLEIAGEIHERDPTEGLTEAAAAAAAAANVANVEKTRVSVERMPVGPCKEAAKAALFQEEAKVSSLQASVADVGVGVGVGIVVGVEDEYEPGDEIAGELMKNMSEMDLKVSYKIKDS